MIDYKNKVMEIIEYIEKNIKINICLNDLSSRFNISKYHMSRTFKSLTGDSIVKYIRSRKLAVSLRYLMSNKHKIIDIALNLGFEYEQSYIRAFKTEFNITPHQFRLKRPQLHIVHKLTIHDLLLFEDGLLLTPSMVFLNELKLIGKDYRINTDSYLSDPNRVGVQFLTVDSLVIQGDVDRSRYYSIVKKINPERTTFHYCPCLEYRGNISYPSNMNVICLGASEYIQFRYMGNHSPYLTDMVRLNDIHSYIDDKYLNYLDSKCDLSFKLERIIEENCSDNYCEMDILYKVK